MFKSRERVGGLPLGGANSRKSRVGFRSCGHEWIARCDERRWPLVAGGCALEREGCLAPEIVDVGSRRTRTSATASSGSPSSASQRGAAEPRCVAQPGEPVRLRPPVWARRGAAGGRAVGCGSSRARADKAHEGVYAPCAPTSPLPFRNKEEDAVKGQ